MVAAANPLAVEAGYQMIQAGGSAVDAAIAVQLVLTLVEPQSSGIGGGSLMLVWDGQKVAAVDGRETAPAAATDQLFMKDGKPMAFYDGVVGGRSVGAPGTVRALALAHQRYGKLPWAALFEPAITLAEQGFVISPRLAAAGQGSLSCQDGRAGLLLSGRRQPQAGGQQTDQPGAGQGAAYPGKPGAGRLLSRPAGRGHGGQGARPPDQPRGAERGRSRQLPRQAARWPLL